MEGNKMKDFKVNDIQHGMMEVTFNIDDVPYALYPTAATNALGDLVSALAAVHPLCDTTQWKFEKSYPANYVFWDQNAIVTEWKFTLEDDTLYIRVQDQAKGIGYNTSRHVLHETTIETDLTSFTTMIVREMDRIIKQYGILGYRQHWQEHTFPIDSYLALKQAMLKDCSFGVNNKEQTSLDEEVAILLATI